MKKIIGILAVVGILVAIFVTVEALYLLRQNSLSSTVYQPMPLQTSVPQSSLPPMLSEMYEVYVDSEKTQFSTYDDALIFAKNHQNAAIRQKGRSEWLWDNYLPYNVFVDDHQYMEFETFAEAVHYAKTKSRAFIYYRKDNNLIWTSVDAPEEAAQIEGVPLIMQLPELRRGCEVTSLVMLLQFYGIDTDKMTLAQQVAKDPAPYELKNGQVHWGNPNTGFVGEMQTDMGNGFGVYHKPIHDLLTEYFPRSALDLTGCDFDDVLYFINGGTPVWVITNTSYAKLPASSFYTWQTPSGEVKITYSEHAVVITGYDADNVYFNDPLGEASSAKRNNFIEAWEQMGKQAVAVSD